MNFNLLIFVLLIFLSTALGAWERTGHLTLEARQFEDDGHSDTFENQRAIEAHYSGKGDFGDKFFILSFAARYDDQDKDRNLLWPEDIYLTTPMFEASTFIVGYQIFNFSYMEAFHPLDVINARILDVSIVNADKMGELVMGFETELGQGNFRFYLMPYPTRPIIPGKSSRLRLNADFHKSVWIGQDGEEPDWSDHFLISWERSFDSLDLMFVTSKSMDRSRLIMGTENYTEFKGTVYPDSSDFFTLFFYERFFSGVNFVYNFESFQMKGSLAYSYYLAEDEIYTPVGLQRPYDHSIAAFGFEKQISHSNGTDSTLLIEGQKVFVNQDDIDNYALQNDVFIGWRWAFNDVNSKELTFGTMADLSSSLHEGFSQLKYSQRMFETWKIELFVIDYYIPDKANLNALGLFRDKEHFSIKLTRYF